MKRTGWALAACAAVLLSTDLPANAGADGAEARSGVATPGATSGIIPLSQISDPLPLPPPGPGDTFDCVIEPKMKIKLGSADTGIIEQVKVDQGEIVRPGDVVATLDSQLQQLAVRMARLKAASDVDVKSEEARLAYRETAALRNEALHQKEFVSTKAYDEAMVEKQLAALAVQKAQNDHRIAQEELAQAQTRLDRRSIRTPIGGVVVEVTSKPGEYVYEQTPVMTIADIDPLFVKVFVPVRYYGEVTVGTEADVVPQAPVGGSYRARVSVVDRVFDPASSTFGVRLVLPNPSNKLPAGLRCRIRFLIKAASR